MSRKSELITILFIALCSSRPGFADDRSVLHYDHPIAENLKRLDHSVPRSQINARFMGQALPLGNGRFGAMFSGHVDSEYLVFNDITLDLLPALPSAWPKGSVKGLRARGGFEVDMEWKDGQLVQATIRANRDGAFRIYAQDKLSKVISLNKGQSKVWPSGI